MDIAAKLKSVSMEVLKARLVAQIRSQMGDQQPKAVVFYGTHEPLEPTTHTVVDLQKYFANRGICFVEFPPEHRPTEFFTLIFDIFADEVGRMGDGEILSLPLDSCLQQAIGKESRLLFEKIKTMAGSMAERFERAWAVNPKKTAWDLGLELHPLVGEGVPTLYGLAADRRVSFGFPNYYTERFFVVALKEIFPQAAFYPLHLSLNMNMPNKILGTRRVINSGLFLKEGVEYT